MKKKMQILILGVIVFIVLLCAFFLVRVLAGNDNDSINEKGDSSYVTGTIVSLNPLAIYTDDIPGYTIFSLQAATNIDISKLSKGQKIKVLYSGNSTDLGPPSLEGVSEITIIGNATDEELNSMLECYQEYLN